MNLRLILPCVLVAGGMVGLAMPLISSDSSAFDANADPATTNPANDSALLALSSGDTAGANWGENFTLKRESDGHFYADVSVDGQDTRMLIDTGASVVALTGDDASALGLSWDEAAIKPVAQGANGAVYGVHTVLPQLSVGGFEAQNVPAIIIPEGLFISLLGQSFLSTIGKVEIAGDNLVLSN